MKERALGSILDNVGHLLTLTNWHVVQGYDRVAILFKPKKDIELKGEPLYFAKVLKVDQVTDLALLKIENPPDNLPTLKLGNMDDVEVVGGGKVVHVADVAQAIDLAIDKKKASGKIYNLVDFYVDNMTIAKMARKICDSKSNVSGAPKQPINTIGNTRSKTLGVRYAGTEGLRRYIQELVKLI